MSDDFLAGLGEEPIVAKRNELADEFGYPVGYNFAFAGFGQCGGRIVNTFTKLGYRRVCAVNTTPQDMDGLHDAVAKLDIGRSLGAGKDPERAAAVAADKDEDIFDLYKRAWGSDVDYAFVCLSAGGGTGAGAFVKGVEVARRYMTSIGKPPRVGVIVALPKDSEGQRPALNATHTFQKLHELRPLSPVLFIDNQQFCTLFANIPLLTEKDRSNVTTAGILHAFNRVSGMRNADIGGPTFDRADFSRLLDSGLIAFAAHQAKSWDSASDLSTPIRERLKSNCLASVDISHGNVAGLLYGLGGTAQATLTVEQFEHATSAMTRLMSRADGTSTVYQGVFPVDGDGLQIMAMVGGLPWPKGRIEAFLRTSGANRDALAALLDV